MYEELVTGDLVSSAESLGTESALVLELVALDVAAG